MPVIATTKARLDVVPLTQHIGAEIRGLDLHDKPDDETIKAIYRAWLDHLVIVFPDQRLEQEDLVRVTGYFGEMGFHHDMIHSEMPDKATLLYSVEIPDTGGNTLFASGYAAYDTLDPAVRNELGGRKAIHHYNYGSTLKGDSKGTEAFGECIHPVFRTNEDTHRKAVYVNRLMTVGIVDMPKEESGPLLNAVFDHAEKKEFVYEHAWRVGDLLLWDNRCSSHARTDFPSTQRRLMWRTTVRGAKRPY